jgi:hypothetical protein
MALELIGLLEAVGSITALVNQAGGLVQKIQSRILAQNKQVQQQLADTIKKTQESIAQAGSLAHVAEDYSRTQENILQALWRCREAESFIKDNLIDFRNRERDNYSNKWMLLD